MIQPHLPVRLPCYDFAPVTGFTLGTCFLAEPDIDLGVRQSVIDRHVLLRKEVIPPHLPIRLPCYDFTPIICPTFGGALLAVKLPTSGVTDSHGVTGGVYKARERIHGSMLTCHY